MDILLRLDTSRLVGAPSPPQRLKIWKAVYNIFEQWYNVGENKNWG